MDGKTLLKFIAFGVFIAVLVVYVLAHSLSRP